MNEILEQVLSKNIWELERRIEAGHRDLPTRRGLLRAYAKQIEGFEERLGIPLQDRAFLKIREEGEDGVLLLHGSAGSPAQVRALAEFLHGRGFNVYAVRLPGQDGGRQQPRPCPWQTCLSEAETRYRLLAKTCQKVFVVGYSFGAALALHLDQTPPPSALALLAPAVRPRLSMWERLLLRLGLLRLPWVWRRLGAQAEALDAMVSARHRTWWRRTPVLGVIAHDDPRVDPRGLDDLASHSEDARSRMELLEAGGHAILEGPDARRIHEMVSEFFVAAGASDRRPPSQSRRPRRRSSRGGSSRRRARGARS